MKTIITVMVFLTLVGCAEMRFAPVSRRIGNEAVGYVSSEQNVTFTKSARLAVIEKTDAYVEPGSTSAPEELVAEVRDSLGNHVSNYKMLSPHASVITEVDLERLVIKKRDYGSLRLASDPLGADVICTSHGNTNEGRTKTERVYPVGAYIFLLKKDGCKETSIRVEIEKGIVRDENVKLECKSPS